MVTFGARIIQITNTSTPSPILLAEGSKVTWPSFLLSSVAFGLIHQSNWIPGTIAGMAYAAALYHRRRIGDAIAAHAVTNALLGTYVIATGSWASWG